MASCQLPFLYSCLNGLLSQWLLIWWLNWLYFAIISQWIAKGHSTITWLLRIQSIIPKCRRVLKKYLNTYTKLQIKMYLTSSLPGMTFDLFLCIGVVFISPLNYQLFFCIRFSVVDAQSKLKKGVQLLRTCSWPGVFSPLFNDVYCSHWICTGYDISECRVWYNLRYSHKTPTKYCLSRSVLVLLSHVSPPPLCCL